MSKILDIINKRKLTPKDCEYHTFRTDSEGNQIRALVIKGETTIHFEYTCGKCGNSGYVTDKYEKVSKASKIRYKHKCDKCGNTLKIVKLKKMK